MIDRKVHSGFVRPPAEPNADDIKASVNEFLETNPVTPGASAEEAAQIKLNAENIEKLQTLSEGLDTVVISDSAPNTDNKCLWIQSGQYESFDLPQINDETVSEEDTWSSKKISDELNAQVSQLSEEIASTADVKVDAHNTGTDTHSDIRLLISGLTDRLNALCDSDDTTLDQLSEVVAYIKSNRTLIDAITINKVSVSDIINNLTTNVANKPLSAAQGVALKALIDEMNVPASTIADNGKVLSVVDGVPSWTITSSEQAAISAANAEQSATIAQECAQAMAGTFDFTGYLRYRVVDTAPETYEEGVLYLVTNS